jgi:hypothetical protein
MVKKIGFPMKNKVKDLILILGMGINELVIDINVGETTFNSIEWSPEEDKILMHIFEENDYDYFCDFEDLTSEQQLLVYKSLSIIYN